MVRTELDKIYSALITPMNNDESINFLALRKIINMQLKQGVEGFYCCGSSGEGLLLTLDERKSFLEEVIESVNGKVPVIAHIGTIRTRDVIELAKHAMLSGADAVSMIPPYYYNFSTDELILYYEEVIKSVPNVRIIIYNIPQFTGVTFTKENAERLLKNPAVVGIKHTSTDLFGLERMVSEYPEKIFFNGFDEIFLSGLVAGAQGAIGTTINLYPKTFIELRDSYQAGKIHDAQKLQTLINHRVESMLKVGIFNAVKYGFTIQGIDCGMCRAPFKALTSEQKKTLNILFKDDFN